MRRFRFRPWLLLASLALCSIGSSNTFAVDVEIELSSGDKVRGPWDAASGETITIGQPPKVIELSQVTQLRPLDPESTGVPPAMEVTLVDGSSIRANEVTADGSTVKVSPNRQATMSFVLNAVRGIRFRPSAANTDPQWLGLFERELRSDLLVIHRGNAQLDPVEGVVLSIDDKMVLFELDGEKIEAPLDRLEGVILRNRTETRTSKVRLEDINGTQLVVSRMEVEPAGESVRLTLGSGVQHELKISQIKRIQFASGTQLLTRQKPASQTMSPYLKTNVSESLFDAWFAPASEGDDLSAVAGGSVEYRVDEGFENLVGSVGRDPSSEGQSKIKIQIAVDEEVVWEQDLADDSIVGFRLPVTGARRVKFTVLPTPDGDVGDLVRFYKPRLLK
ncbi:NPCBM/NEW2 domain-containing protein [Rhodopirellula sp. MGV]|uniref:NPCBM/NEW2 domain-containing protein n=1 Tax=Rhodopirellula sp. MGV TaxID=2023130 RepID=UPI0013040B75|nr:NPCBM/NEW2 domain-containing protein [Rhodopirellula sp. MGV]